MKQRDDSTQGYVDTYMHVHMYITICEQMLVFMYASVIHIYIYIFKHMFLNEDLEIQRDSYRNIIVDIQTNIDVCIHCVASSKR